MQSTTNLRRRRCDCGKVFSERFYGDTECPACRPLDPARSREDDALFRFWVAGERERWAAYLQEIFGPLLASKKDVITKTELLERLYGKPVAKPAKKKAVA